MKIWIYAGLAVAGMTVALSLWLLPYYDLAFLVAMALDPGKILILSVIFWTSLAVSAIFSGLAVKAGLARRGWTHAVAKATSR